MMFQVLEKFLMAFSTIAVPKFLVVAAAMMTNIRTSNNKQNISFLFTKITLCSLWKQGSLAMWPLESKIYGAYPAFNTLTSQGWRLFSHTTYPLTS
jgi:hypothetical protein